MLELENPDVWSNPERAQQFGKEKSGLEAVVSGLDHASQSLLDATELIELAAAEDDEATATEVEADIQAVEKTVAELEFRRMFSGEMDANNAFVDIQSGAGGTEAQDWAEMLLRMYLRWGEAKGFKTELIEVSDGDVAGIKTLAGYALKPGFIDWYENPRSIRVIGAIPRSRLPLFRRKSQTTSISISIRLTCASTFTALAAQAVST
jgi:protein subunit release factor A